MRTSFSFFCFATLSLSIAMVVGCGGPTDEPADTANSADDVVLVVVTEGLSTPESAEFDPASGDIFVSNIVVDPETPIPERYWTEDGTGYITRLGADGTIKEKEWRKADLDSVLHGPKGITIADGVMYICDNANLVAAPLDESKPVSKIDIPGAEYLNDVCVERGVIYASDTKRGLVYKIDGDQITEIQGPESINGITLLGDSLYAISLATPDLFLLDQTGEKPAEGLGLTSLYKKGDGIEPLEDGTLLVTDFEAGKVLLVSADLKSFREIYALEGDEPSLADIDLDPKTGKLFIPSVLTDRLIVIDYKKAIEMTADAEEPAEAEEPAATPESADPATEPTEPSAE